MVARSAAASGIFYILVIDMHFFFTIHPPTFISFPVARTTATNDAPVVLSSRSIGSEQQHKQVGSKMGRTPSMQRVASLEHLQKKIRGGVSTGPLSWGVSWDLEGPSIEEQGSGGD